MTYIIISIVVLSFGLEEDDFYFQLSTSENEDNPEEINFCNLKSEYHKINIIGEDEIKIIKKVTSDVTPIKNLSSIIEFDGYLVKTCFGPDKIVEIKDKNSEEIFRPKDDYFKRLKKNLSNIKYCYSTAMKNPINSNEYFIITYWTESSSWSTMEIYTHKYIVFTPSSKAFGNVRTLNSQDNNFYAQSCTNLKYKYIYCTIDPRIPLSKENHFSIDSDLSEINLVKVFGRSSNSIYHFPIGINKEIYTNTGKDDSFFLTVYHDSSSNKTRLMTGLYINYYKTSYIQRFEDLKIDNGINIEDDYIDPNLFNSLLSNDEEIILIYIKKGAEGKNFLSFKRYDYQHPLKEPTTFDTYSQSNYIRDDICQRPKYMQSMFINSPINYDFKDSLLMKVYPNEKYYKYQQDIITIIACDKNNSAIEYQAKKIVMPQCLNILNKINGIEKNNLFTFTQDKTKVILVLDIYNNPNLKSLRNVEIQFLDSNSYNTVLIIQAIQDGKRQPPIVRSSTIFNPEKIEFSRTMNFKKGKKYIIPYQIIISSPNYIKSDLCYFEFYYEDPENEEVVVVEECSVKHCKECQGNTCIECDENITGIQLDKENNECTCDVKNGFNKEPNTTINMCTCKDDYSFYEGIQKCLPDYILNNGPYCITEKDELSSIYIYGYMPTGMAKYYENGLPYCRKPPLQFQMNNQSVDL